jgi:hypothetical protein
MTKDSVLAPMWFDYFNHHLRCEPIPKESESFLLGQNSEKKKIQIESRYSSVVDPKASPLGAWTRICNTEQAINHNNNNSP